MYSNVTVLQFQQFFSRDFPFGTDPNVSVLDADITKAFTFTNMQINQGLFANQGAYTVGYQLLSAHYLVMNLRASSQGINGQFAFLESSKGVGGVSSSFAIPQRVLDNPDWSVLMKTNYGAQYIQLVLPSLCGQMYAVAGSNISPGAGNGVGGYWGIE